MDVNYCENFSRLPWNKISGILLIVTNICVKIRVTLKNKGIDKQLNVIFVTLMAMDKDVLVYIFFNFTKGRIVTLDY